MEKFRFGDKVRVRDIKVGTLSCGWPFTVSMVKYIGKEFTIAEDCGNGVYRFIGSPFYWAEDWLELVEPETIVIYRNGDKTIARNKRTGEEAEAKCSKDDEYDFYTGAKIAFERLIGEDKAKEAPKPKLYNGKVVCITSLYKFLTKGKVYEFKNGFSQYDDGSRLPTYRDAVTSFEDLKNRIGSGEFIELVED